MVKFANAFSLSMLGDVTTTRLIVRKLSKEEVKLILGQGFESYVGHQDTANVLSNELGLDVPCNRGMLLLGKDDVAIVAQYMGGRLPEGATQLPEGTTFNYYLVKYWE